MNDRRLRAFGRVAGGAVGALTFLCLFTSIWRTSFPPLPSRIRLEVIFPRGLANVCEPIITTGQTEDGDFLAVRYLDEENAVLLYDVWGVGGPTSQPFALQPGKRRTLEIEMPTLPHVSSVKSHEKRPLYVALDGGVLLNEPVYFHRRQPAQIYFAANPIGGTLTRENFRGMLALPGGHVLQRGPESKFGWGERLGWMVRERASALLLRVAASIVVGFAVARFLAWFVPWCAALHWRLRAENQRAMFPVRMRAPHGWFLATLALCTLAFTGMITGGTFRLIYPESFGHIYDYQAISLLQGRLDLPEAAHSAESFVFEGRHYIYFGPTPALLRLPLMIFKIAVGQWSRCYMVAYYAALLAAVYALLVHVNRIATGAKSWPSPTAVMLFVGTTGLSTTIFFLGSRAYVYHEAILCGAMFALWSSFFSLQFLTAASGRSWIWALLLGIVAVHARPSTGLFALTLLACAAVATGMREFAKRREMANAFHRPLLIAALAALGVLSYNGVSYLKFKSFEGMPLRYNVQYSPKRLTTFDGRNFHLANLRFNFGTYFWRPYFTVTRGFPFFYIQGPHTADYPDVKSDMAEPTVAMPYTMPAIFLLAFGGGALALARWPAARRPLFVVGAAATPMALALLTVVVVSERYTADFCPALILAGIFGLQAIELLPAVGRRIITVLITVLGLGGVYATAAITLHYQGEVVWGVPDDTHARYQSLRKTVDGVLGLGRE